jgi:hypothetical protein
VDDPHRKPGDRDRADLVARIKRAAEQGRIAAADRDIRLANVANAQSAGELDLIGRDLDQLEATVPAAPPGPAAATTWAGPAAEPVADVLAEKAVDAARTTARSVGLVTFLLVILVGLGVGAVAVVNAMRGSSGPADPGSGGLKDPIPISQAPSPGDATGATSAPTPEPPGPAYSLTAAGIRAFLQAYQERFGTTEVVDLTMYGDYVVVQVPIAGKARHEGWLYRSGKGWTSFGGVSANFPGARPVDTTRLAIRALVGNIETARTTLNVEDPTTTYVIVRQYTPGDVVPSVDIHVANDFSESGYLATTLDGKIDRAYPYAS